MSYFIGGLSQTERLALLQKLQALTEKAKTMTKEEAIRQLIAEGFLDSDGILRQCYGGQGKG